MDDNISRTPEELAKFYGGATRLFLDILRDQNTELEELRKRLAKVEAQKDFLCDTLAREWGINEE